MNNKSIIHIQSGDEKSGGIANYIRLLVTSKNLKSFENVVTVKYINDEIKKKYFGVKFEKFNNEITFLSFFKRIFCLRDISLKYENPLFHSHALKSGILVATLRLLFNKKYIHTNHGLRFTQKPRYLFLIFLAMEIFVIFYSERYICIRTIDYHYLKSKLKNNFLKKKLGLIKLRLDSNFNCKEDIYLNKFKKPYKLIAIGSLIDIKRPKNFIYLINFLVKNGIPIKGIWLGNGYLMKEMLELTRNLNLDITWLGQVDKDIVFSTLKNATYLVQTSKFEVYPTVVLESLSCGTPIISSNYWGVEELIKDSKNGVVLNEKTLTGDKSKIINLFSSKLNYEKMSDFCKTDFQANYYNHNDTSIRYKIIYETI